MFCRARREVVARGIIAGGEDRTVVPYNDGRATVLFGVDHIFVFFIVRTTTQAVIAGGRVCYLLGINYVAGLTTVQGCSRRNNICVSIVIGISREAG